MLFWLFLFFAIGLTGTWLARGYAIQRELFDHPGERRSHAVPTPRGGGIAIVIALLVAACVIGWRNPQQMVAIAGFVVGLVLVAGIGMVDDHRPLSPWLRLGVHAVAAATFALAVAGAWGDLWTALIAFVAVMVLTNIWNFMDGINGLAGTQGVLVGTGLAFAVGGNLGWLALALAASTLGFLPFNFPKARIFLGDVGSGAIGFALAACLVFAIAQTDVDQLLLLLPFSAFLVDSTLTLLRRVVRGERWWTPHVQHAYQRWAARGTHAVVTFAYAGWTVASWLLAWWLASRQENGLVGMTSAAWFSIAAALWAWLQYSDTLGGKSQAAAMEKVRK
jgi:UDP-N-acetylmuramyl pentapeptide phosphotransferase/UDP-N-acetylglucosamine-1-phosphate transferase